MVHSFSSRALSLSLGEGLAAKKTMIIFSFALSASFAPHAYPVPEGDGREEYKAE